MSRSALVVLAALFVTGAAAGSALALPSVGVQPDDTAVDVQPDDDTIAMLTVDSPTRTDHATESVDASRSLSLQREAASNRLDEYAFEARLEAADDDAKRDVVREELDRIDARIDDLVADERTLRQDYLRARMGASEYAAGAADIGARADHLESRLALVRTYAEEHELDTDAVGNVEARLVGFDGPVRERLGASIHGEAPAIRVDVAVSENGTVLSMIEGNSHVREAYREDLRSEGTPRTVPPDELFSLVNMFVSDVYELEPQSTNIRGGLGRGVYVAVVEAPRSTPYLSLTAHIDGATREIFSETQVRQLDRLPAGESVDRVDNGTRLVVDRSFPAGPLHVATYDNSSGTPTSATVVIDGEEFETDADGELWTLAPRRFNFPVTAVGSEGNVTVEVRTLDVRSVGES